MEIRLVIMAACVCIFGRFTEAQLFPVTPLDTPITRRGCGSSKLCLSTEAWCDPAGNSSCNFISTHFINSTLSLEISGTTSGFVGLLLAPATSPLNQTTYFAFACGNNNSNAFLSAAVGNSIINLIPFNVSIFQQVLTDIKVNASVTRDQSLVQCTVSGNLNATFFNLTSFPEDFQLPFSVYIVNGSTNGTELKNAFLRFYSNRVLDLADPKSNTALLNVTRSGCGSTKLCVSNESHCDPAGNSSCFFSSVQLTNQIFSVDLSGTTTGYVALRLTSQESNFVFVCGNDNNTFFFQTATQNGTILTPANVMTVNNVQGVVAKNQTLIQCSFNISPNANATIYNVTIMNGTTNGFQLGAPSVRFDSMTTLNFLDICTPNSESTLIASLCINVLIAFLGAQMVHL